jgi:hypothetical protein
MQSRPFNELSWGGALRSALVSGTAASFITTVVLAACGETERDDPYGPLNGPSQWIWGTQAACRRGFSVRHTVVGYLIHHAMSIFWATFFEKLAASRYHSRPAAETLAIAAATSAVACLVDYRVVPDRFTPGFEKQLSRHSMALTYVAFAAALAGAVWLTREK